jgi:hypothetical protein
MEVAAAFGLSKEDARATYQRLYDHHFFFLDPGTLKIRIANPFSSIPADFRVTVGGKSYWANCAWDMLGIPAMLQQDAIIEAQFSDTGENLQITVQEGVVYPVEGVVHFLIPFREWYDDLIHT